MTQQLTETYFCGVCGKPVDPAVDVMMTAGKTRLFAVHAGECRETIRKGASVITDLVEVRFPVVKMARLMFEELFKPKM